MPLTRAILLIGLGLLAAPAFAQQWADVVRACDDQAERSFCVGKAGCPNWQWLVRCTAGNIAEYQQSPQLTQRLDWCISKIEASRQHAHTPAMVGDPVDDAMRCLAAKR